MPTHTHQEKQRSADTDRWVGITLRTGVWISSAFLAAGLLLVALFPESGAASTQTPTLPDLLGRIFSKEILSPDGSQAASLLYAGLVVLMITPFFRVLATISAFAAQKDWRFVGVALVVFMLLVVELVLSLG